MKILNHIFKRIKCPFGFHRWNGCKCVDCRKTRDEQHAWSFNCQECSRCDKTRDVEHDWSLDCQKCSRCYQTRDIAHEWDGCKCSLCSKTRDEGHKLEGCKCSRCNKKGLHDWNGRKCRSCGAIHGEGGAWNDMEGLKDSIKKVQSDFGYGDLPLSEALQMAKLVEIASMRYSCRTETWQSKEEKAQIEEAYLSRVFAAQKALGIRLTLMTSEEKEAASILVRICEKRSDSERQYLGL